LAVGPNVVQPAVGGEGYLVIVAAGGAGGFDRRRCWLTGRQAWAGAPESHSHRVATQATVEIKSQFDFLHESSILKGKEKVQTSRGELGKKPGVEGDSGESD
jgi:hypothetical protein